MIVRLPHLFVLISLTVLCVLLVTIDRQTLTEQSVFQIRSWNLSSKTFRRFLSGGDDDGNDRNDEVAKKRNRLPRGACGYLIYNAIWGMGLGNMMFSYASAVGLALSGDRYPILRNWHHAHLSQYFQLPPLRLASDDYQPENDTEIERYGERHGCCAFDQNLLSGQCNATVYVTGYLQSRLYFWRHILRIREDFRFRPELLNASRAYLQELVRSAVDGYGHDPDRCVLIGVHPRRGDFALPGKMEFGHNPATVEYLRSAIDFYETLFENVTCLVFVLAGNDRGWNQQSIESISVRRPNQTLFVVMPDASFRSQGFDMCTLSLCDHTVMTTGSFGWWSAFLTRGLVTYQAEFARINSSHYGEYDPKTFFPPSWIPL